MSNASPYPILLHPHDGLNGRAEPAEGATPKVLEILERMQATIYRANGIGLAAPQANVRQRLVVADIGVERADGKRNYDVKMPNFYINPEITWASDETTSLQEGCLSLPNLWGHVVRPSRVKVAYMNRDGALLEEEMNGLAAAVIQHEIDHLDGILFTQRMTKLRRDLAMGKWRKIRNELIKDGPEFDMITAETGLIKAAVR